MKKSFLDRAAAFVVAFVLMVGGVSALPEECFSLIGAVVRAEEAATSGQCGDDVFWELDSNGTLTISGSGEMYDYEVSPFFNRVQIHKIVIKDGVTRIGNNAFVRCLNLTIVTIPNSVTSIGRCAFSNCSSLNNITIPNGVTSIEQLLFAYCTALTNISIPNSVTSIGNSAFLSCKGLTDFTIPGNIKIIGETAFADCSELKNVIISDGVKIIGDCVFQACEKLTNVTIADSVTDIGYYIFEYCSNLKSITIPGSITKIQDYAFLYCSNLTNVSILEGVTEINFWSFGNCNNLRKIVIPKSVTYIDVLAFENSSNLTIYGYTNSYAETYAKENNIPFVALDGGINFTSATMTQYTSPVNVGDELLFNVVIRDSNGNPVNISDLSGELTYTTSVSDNNCIRIDSESTDLTGAFIKATAVGEGTATVTVTFDNGVTAQATVKVGNSGDTTDYSQYLNFELTGVKFTYESGHFTPLSKEVKYFYGAYLIDTDENKYGNDVILSNVSIKLIAPTGFSFDESGQVITYSKDFAQLRLNTDDCSGYITLYPQNYTYPTVKLKAEIYVDDVMYDTYEEIIRVEKNNSNAVDVSKEYDETDSDGDGLPDVWEKYGITYEGDFLDLPAMGADPNVPDVFVEVDWKSGINPFDYSTSLEMVYKQFKNHKINLHIDAGAESKDYVTGKTWGNLSEANSIKGNVVISFSDEDVDAKKCKIKGEWKQLVYGNFSLLRSLVFRHCIFGEKINSKKNDEIVFGVAGGIPSQYLFIAYDTIVEKYGKEQMTFYIALNFMHELGHTLGLSHGGYNNLNFRDDTNYKPNYLSIMNYSFRDGLLFDDESKKYSLETLNYSEYSLPPINENNIFERLGVDPYRSTENSGGICTRWFINAKEGEILQRSKKSGIISGKEIDFNKNGSYDIVVSLDLNQDEKKTILAGTTNDWEHLIYKGGCVGGANKDIQHLIDIFWTDDFLTDIPIEEPRSSDDFNHYHDYNTSWSNNDTFHWHECSCGEKSDTENHISDGGTVTKEPTETAEGERTYKCTKCGYVIRTESIPKKVVVPVVPAPVYPVYNTTSSPSFSTEPVITSGTTHTRPKLTLKAETAADSICLSWNKISGAKKYTVYIYINGRYERLRDTAGTSFVFKNPVHGKTYRFLVRYSVNGRLSAEMFSGKVTVTVYLKPVVTAYSGKNSIKLSWKPVSGAEKYAVYRYKNGRGSKIYETENTYAVIKNLKSGAKYSYVVRAYVGGKWTSMTRSDIVTAVTE